MHDLSRRDFLWLGLAAGTGLAQGNEAPPKSAPVHQQILELAARQEKQRRELFAAVKTPAQLQELQQGLRRTFLKLLDGLPDKGGVPPAKKLATLEGDDYVVEKLVYESFPGYFVSALLYRPKQVKEPLPGILSPCGHSTTGKAGGTYQILHINLAKRGYVVLTYDPVGQGERSQFWDAAKQRSRFNLSCGEHCVLGNPLYLLGTSLARYRIWDGIRGLDYLAARPEVKADKLGCIGNSGGGTLTAYISALDPRVQVPVIGCYITTLPRRMANRIEADPDSDPEQDIFGFVGGGIDHAGLLALMVPRPTLLCTAKFDFFPIEGARETFAEALKLYQAAGAPSRIERVEAEAKHGLSAPLRVAAYGWFDRWLHGRKPEAVQEITVTPRPAKDLLVCADGQVNVTFQSRPLLPLAREHFQKRKPTPRLALRDVIRFDALHGDPHITKVTPLTRADQTLVMFINGTESADWQEEKELLRALSQKGFAVTVVDPRGVGKLRPGLQVKGHDYADPLCGVEENLAYNAFLVDRTLIGMRVADVMVAMRLRDRPYKRLVLCARRDAALVACLAVALFPSDQQVAVEEMRLSYWPLFEAEGQAINAANIVPGMLRDYGDIPDVLAQIAPRKVLAAAPLGKLPRPLASLQITEKSFSKNPAILLDWLQR